MPRQFPVIDVSAHLPLAAEASQAFQTDMSYAIAMAKQASLIKLKREVWKKKGEAKKLAQAAAPA